MRVCVNEVVEGMLRNDGRIRERKSEETLREETTVATVYKARGWKRYTIPMVVVL